jgi:hypothetical protein
MEYELTVYWNIKCQVNNLNSRGGFAQILIILKS